MPPPNITLEIIQSPDELTYSGRDLTLQCYVILDELSDTNVTVSVKWLKNGDDFVTCSDLHQHSGNCSIVFTPLSYKTDNGNYSCQAVVTPTDSYPFLISHNVTSGPISIQVASEFELSYRFKTYPFFLLHAVPNVAVSIFSSVTLLLPYNHFVGSCTASVTVSGLQSQEGLKGSWQWMRRGVGECQFNNITHTSTDSIIHNESRSMSELYHDEVIEGNVTYRCIYSLEGIDNISNNKEIMVSVIGK